MDQDLLKEWDKFSQEIIQQRITDADIDISPLNLSPQNLIRPRAKSQTKNRRQRIKKKTSIPRPSNDFVLYLKNFRVECLRNNPDIEFGRISSRASKKWQNETQNIKQLFKQLSYTAKEIHGHVFPDANIMLTCLKSII